MRPTGNFCVWQIVEDSSTHFKMVGIRQWWRWKRGEFGGLDKVYGIFSIPIILICAAIILGSVHTGFGKVSITWEEFVPSVLGLFVWLVFPFLLAALPNPVWEARPGLLRFSKRHFDLSHVKGLEIKTPTLTRTIRFTPGAGSRRNSIQIMRVTVVLTEGAPLRIGSLLSSIKQARYMIQRLAEVSGVPLARPQNDADDIEES